MIWGLLRGEFLYNESGDDFHLASTVAGYDTPEDGEEKGWCQKVAEKTCVVDHGKQSVQNIKGNNWRQTLKVCE